MPIYKIVSNIILKIKIKSVILKRNYDPLNWYFTDLSVKYRNEKIIAFGLTDSKNNSSFAVFRR